MPKWSTPFNWLVILVFLGTVLFGYSCAQKSCGRHHEDASLIHEGEGNADHARVKDLEQQLAGKNAEVENLKAWGRTTNAKLEALKKRAQQPLPPVPATDAALAASLQELGLQPGVQVQVAAPTSILSTVDAQTAWVALEQAKKVPLLQEALVACDQSVKAQEAVVLAQDGALRLSSEALKASQAEAAARQAQAQELGKALRVEKSKGWQKWAAAGGAVLVTLLVKK